MLVYSFVGFLRPAIYIFLLPLYLSVFTDAEYGIYDLMVTTGGIMMVIVTLRLNAAMLTQYYDYHGDRKTQRLYLQTLFSASFFIAVLSGLLFYFFGESIFQFVFRSDDVKFFPYGFTILLYALLSEVNACYYIYLKNEKNLTDYVFIILTQVLLAILFQFLLIIVFRQGVQGALLGMLLSNIITFLIILLKEKNIFTFKINSTMIRSSLKFSSALIPYLVIYWILTKGGKIMLERHADLSQVGVFALLVTISSIILLTVDAVVNGVRPFMFELFAENRTLSSSAEGTQSSDKENDYHQRMDLLTKIVIMVPLTAVPFIVLIGNNIGILTSKPSYQDIGHYISFASFVIFMLVYGKLFYQQLIFSKRSDIVTVLSFCVLIFLLIGFYYLVPSYKIWGVLAATGLANALMALFLYFAGRKYLPIRFNKWNIFLLPFVFFTLLFAMEWIMVERTGMSRALFGVVQFLVLIPLIILTNLNSVKAYKNLFLSKK